MNIIKAGYEILTEVDGDEILKQIERAGRLCYKSEERITDKSAPAFVKMLIARGHDAMLEHASLSVKFICDRGVSHELVRHRIASFAQESTRYCNYSADKFSNEITVIQPNFFDLNSYKSRIWLDAMLESERMYFELLQHGATPQEARTVLPNSLKTEIIITANMREWRNIFNLRTTRAAHPQVREITIPLLKELRCLIPVLFDDCGTLEW